MKLKVLITTNIPAPYFVDYANELGKYTDLTVIFELENAKNREKSWIPDLKEFSFKPFFLNAIRLTNESGLSFSIIKYLDSKRFDRIIIANPTTPTGIIALLHCRRCSIPHIIQSEGGFRGNGKGIKEKFKKYLMENADMYLTGMGLSDDYFLSYGATVSSLKPFHFSSLHDSDVLRSPMSPSDKANYKLQLGINTEHMVLYVGQFIKRKGIDILLRSFGKITDDCCLVLIGGTLTKQYKKIIKSNNIKNVIAVDFLNKEQLDKYYYAADLFAMATREDTWGLVINEAMSKALPVVTTKNCIAGKYLVKNGKNGYLVDINNVKLLTKYIENILNDDMLRNSMSMNSLKTIEKYTIENMAKDVFKHIS